MNKHGLYDIYDVWHVPFWQTTAFFYSMVALGVVGVLLSIWFIIKKMRSKQKVQTPGEKALHQLHALQNSNITVDNGKEFYFALTAIVKKYLEDRYGYKLTHKTDAECVKYLENNQLLPNHLDDLRRIFSGVEIIKFANAQAAYEQMLNDVQRTILLVQSTKIKTQ